jgi:23S rRNA (guanine745-N1)-methyltransferase
VTTAPLRCPHCWQPLERGDRTWACPDGHSFDIARQGYVNLTGGRRPHTGDTVEMLQARSAILRAGHLDVVTDAVVASCRGLAPGVLVEAGAGTAHHLARVRQALGAPHAVALDSSVAAARRAARADPPALTSVVADVWQPWPVCDHSAAAVLTIFAPRNLLEAVRVLVPAGRLVVVTPAADHLSELAETLGLIGVESDKGRRLDEQAEGTALEQLSTSEVRTRRVLDRATAAALACMGPSGHHVAPEVLARRSARLPSRSTVTIAVQVRVYRAA